jgi:hypothetical protein
MTTSINKFIRENVENLSSKKIGELLDHEEEKNLKKQIYEEAYNELQPLIEENKQAIDAVRTEYFHDVYTARKTEIEKHIKNLSPQNAYAYLVDYEIELSKNAPADDDYSGLSRHYRKQIDLLKNGDVKKYVELRDRHDNAKIFRDICLIKLLAEYKKRAAELPEAAPKGAGENVEDENNKPDYRVYVDEIDKDNWIMVQIDEECKTKGWKRGTFINGLRKDRPQYKMYKQLKNNKNVTDRIHVIKKRIKTSL